MSRDPTVLLRHIRLCLDRIADYARGGQAVRDYGIDHLEAAAPTLPWQRIAGLRNVLAHQYLGVDLRLLWNIVENELPKLDGTVSRLLPPNTR